MFKHTCSIDDMKIMGQRPNPINASWSEWTLVVCTKCKKLYEWQHHSEEQMHGGDLFITALPTPEYLHYMYALEENDIEKILEGKKTIRRYDRYKKTYHEENA